MKTREFKTIDAPTVHHITPIEINLIRQGYSIIEKDYKALTVTAVRDIIYTLRG